MDEDPKVIDQETSVRWLLHLPHCLGCLAHNNSYLFRAWYDLPKDRVEVVARLLKENYPKGLQQPLFFTRDERVLELRLPCGPDKIDHNGGDLDIDSLIVKFCMCLDWPTDEERKGWGIKSEWLEMEFNLSTPEGWQRYLRNRDSKETREPWKTQTTSQPGTNYSQPIKGAQSYKTPQRQASPKEQVTTPITITQDQIPEAVQTAIARFSNGLDSAWMTFQQSFPTMPLPRTGLSRRGGQVVSNVQVADRPESPSGRHASLSPSAAASAGSISP